MTTYSSFLAWKIPWNFQWSLVGYSVWGQKESDMTKYICTYLYVVSFLSKVNLSQVVQSLSHVWLCHPMSCSIPGFPVHQLPELAQTYVYWVSDAIQPSHPLLYPSPPAFSLSHYQDLSWWVSSSHLVAKVLEFQLQHQFFQWIFRTDFL